MGSLKFNDFVNQNVFSYFGAVKYLRTLRKSAGFDQTRTKVNEDI